MEAGPKGGFRSARNGNIQETTGFSPRSFIKNLVIPQERYETNGVFISRPSSTGERIRNIIVFNNIQTLDGYALWLHKNIKYKRDKGKDSWSSPGETLQKKYGDCEDLAFLNEAVLRALNYQPKVLIVVRPLNNHAICVFKENSYYSLIDNTKLIRTKTGTILEFSKFLFMKYGFSSLREINFKTRQWGKKLDILRKDKDGELIRPKRFTFVSLDKS